MYLNSCWGLRYSVLASLILFCCFLSFFFFLSFDMNSNIELHWNIKTQNRSSKLYVYLTKLFNFISSSWYFYRISLFWNKYIIFPVERSLIIFCKEVFVIHWEYQRNSQNTVDSERQLNLKENLYFLSFRRGFLR